MRSEVAARLPRSLEEERKMKKAGPSPEHSHAMTQKPRSFRYALGDQLSDEAGPGGVSLPGMSPKSLSYGRMLEDFEVGDVYEHPWDVTVDAGHVALFQASFMDATPTYASARYARELGFRDRPLHPLLLMNLGLSFSVHDVSEQAIAHLAYIDVHFPEAAYAGDTLTASSRVLGIKPASSGDRGVVHVRTLVRNQDERIVCAFERKALVRSGGKLPDRPRTSWPPSTQPERTERLPSELRGEIRKPSRRAGFEGFADSFAPGDVIVHGVGRTVSEAEHMMLAYWMRNSHPLHFDEMYCKGGASFAGTRVVYGGLVFSWIAQLASRDTTGNVVWDVGFDGGAHPAGVVAGDTLYAASKVLAVEPHDDRHARVTFRLVGVKNAKPADLLAAGADLFSPELGKKEGKVKEKVFEIDRTVLMRKRPA
jgi:2-methylfumaryl-CoA hydratase